MDYVKNNGVSIKVDYVVEEQDNLYIAFNIVTEEEYAKLYLDETIIKAKNRNNNENEYTNSEAVQKSKRISKYNYIIIYKFKIAKFNTDVVGLDVKANKIRVKTSNNIFKLINSECKFFIAI